MFAKDGTSVIITVLVISVLLAVVGLLIPYIWVSYLFYLAAFLLTAFTLFFFRDPDRVIPNGDDFLIAPADGKVILIQKVKKHKYLQADGTQISIFLSPLDVHVNRIPASGIIEHEQYFPGEYLVAWHEKSSDLNERSEFVVRHDKGTKIYFKQIAGFVARRIVYHIGVGDHVKAGERFGMMRFGSRMDIIVPNNVSLKVKKGQRTIGGETILGIIE
ncbi:MAG TPA: phosphatidylserine decarboxylase family protein [Balneolales bacterium]|nr:phosphatidylserine decarboxylase family protein [Balneolales bacterium]